VKRRGLTIAPEIAVGDGALGFWKALDEIYPRTRRCFSGVHRTGRATRSAIECRPACGFGFPVRVSKAHLIREPLGLVR